MRKQTKSTLVLGLLLSLGISLSACSTADTKAEGQADNPHSSMDHGSDHSKLITDKQSFALMMIPHHQQAVVMSEFARTNSTNPEVLSIAEQIIAEQAPEIAVMTPWLKGKEVDSDMEMDGMLTNSQLQDLENSTGEAFDKLYLEYMILHHEGALVMAADAVKIDDPELVDFANEIIRAQSAEIEVLLQLLANY